MKSVQKLPQSNLRQFFVGNVYTKISLKIRMDVMKLTRKWISCLIMVLLFCGSILNCRAESSESPTDLLVQLNEASTITVKKSWFSFNKNYKVYVDDEKVGEIEGLYFNIFGERLVLKDLDGDVYGSEQQIKRWNVRLNRLAQVYNGADDTVGFIGEQVIRDFLRWGKTFHFYDVNQDEIAVSKQKMFRIFPEYVIEDMNGEKLYKVKKKFSLFTTTYEIAVYNSNILPVEQTLFLTVILNSIDESEESNE